MIAILVAFWAWIILFAIIGAMRGWAKTFLVIFSVILALAFISVVENLIPGLSTIIKRDPITQFWVRVGILTLLIFFGFQSPRLTGLASPTMRREQIQDLLLGFILGIVSGFFVVGTYWYFIEQMGYFPPYIYPPDNSPLGQAANQIANWLPPVWLSKGPTIYITTVLSFIFVIVVLI